MQITYHKENPVRSSETVARLRGAAGPGGFLGRRKPRTGLRPGDRGDPRPLAAPGSSPAPPESPSERSPASPSPSDPASRPLPPHRTVPRVPPHAPPCPTCRRPPATLLSSPAGPASHSPGGPASPCPGGPTFPFGGPASSTSSFLCSGLGWTELAVGARSSALGSFCIFLAGDHSAFFSSTASALLWCSLPAMQPRALG